MNGTQATDNPTQSDGAIIGIAIGTLLLTAIFGALLILAILVGCLFYKINRNGRNNQNRSNRSSNSRGRRVFTITSSTYASINDRGRIRRQQTSHQQSQRSRVSLTLYINIYIYIKKYSYLI